MVRLEIKKPHYDINREAAIISALSLAGLVMRAIRLHVHTIVHGK